MWRGIVFCSALGILVHQLPAAAQDVAEPVQPLRLQKFLRLHVAGGRIEVQQREIGQSRTVTNGEPESPYRQHLQLQVRPPCVVVEYQAVDPQGCLSLRFCEKHKLTIECAPADPADGGTVRYEQPPSGPVRLTVEESGTCVYSAPSLWHLLLVQPKVCGEHLVPMLDLVSPGWRLAEQAESIKANLIAGAPKSDIPSDEKEWTRLVDELASEQFSRRQAADAVLRSGGRPAAAFLSRMDRQRLSAEQRLRIEQICRLMDDGATDTPQRVATWLAGDRQVWLSLLGDSSAEVRIAASEQLSGLLGRPVAFEPLADETTRASQLASLGRRLGGK